MTRLGRRHRPFFRINAVDQRSKRDGRFIENLGWYDPVAKNPARQFRLNEDRIKHWLSVGAQPSETVANILVKHNLMDGTKIQERHARRVAAKQAKAAASAASEGAGGE